MINPFHLAIQVRDLAEAKTFYVEYLNCSVGRSSASWVDLNLFGHQLVCHENQGMGKKGQVASIKKAVDEKAVPVPHFGVVLEMNDWQGLADTLQAKNVDFLIPPNIRFKGEAGEQATFFFKDPSGNALEFKSFKNIESQLFARKP